jgi:HEAT repeat protein
MRLPKTLGIVLVLGCLAGPAPAGPPKGKGDPLDLKGKTLAQTLDDLLPGMGAKDLPARQGPQQRWQEICLRAGAPGKEPLRAEACKVMLGKLGPKTPAPARVWLLKQLEQIGRAESVDAVAAVLDDKDEQVRDAAVRALAANPAPAAATKLVAKLPSAAPKLKVPLLNALGYRADKSAVAAVTKELSAAEAEVAVAAARALGKIATPEAAKSLAAARGKARGPVRLALTDAYLLCADRRLEEGKGEEAAAIYRELNRPEEPRPVRLAALRGLLSSAGDKAGEMVLELLGGTDADARAVATGQIDELKPGALKALARGLEKLPASSQVLVLGALAARGDKSQMPAAVAAAKSKNGEVRVAGVLALGKLGDASVVPLLLDLLGADPQLASAAGKSLAQVPGEEVSEKLVAALKGAKVAARKRALIDILEQRKAAAAVPILLKDAQGGDAGLRAAAMSALRQLAEPKDVPEMVKGLVKAARGREREDAERAVAAVCARIADPEKRAAPVLAFLETGLKYYADVLPVLGRLGGMEVREILRAALGAGDDAQVEGAVQGLCNWPDRSVTEDLLKLAEKAKRPDQRKAALRALVRVSSNPNEGATAERLAALKKAMALAPGDDERKVVLEGFGGVRDIEALRYVLPYLKNKDLAQQACKAVVELAHSKKLREPNRAEFEPALDRVIAICRDRNLVERARRYKLGL